jgi:Fe-S-cluster-containing hydrogenase component 2
LACPFGAVEIFTGRYGHGDGQAKDAVLVNKCDLCKDGTEPACAAACPNKALRIVDTASEINEKRIAAVSALPGGV